MDFLTQLADEVINVNPLPNGAGGASDGLMTHLFNVVIAIAASISFLIIVLAGLRYIISRGDTQKVAQSKSAIIYALVGLIVSMAAYAIVNLVVSNL